MPVQKPTSISPSDSSFNQVNKINEMFSMLFDYVNQIIGTKIIRHIVVPSFGSDESISATTGNIGVLIPEEMDGYVLTDVLSSVYSYSSSGDTKISIRIRRNGVDKNIDEVIIPINTYYGTKTVKKIVQKGDLFFIDVTLAGSGAKGLFTVLTFRGDQKFRRFSALSEKGCC